MTTELRIPNVGESIQEVQISHWLKQEGDRVNEDENIVELETDKASMELPSPASGILKIVKREGEAVAIGETIAYVDDVPAESSAGPQAKSGTEKSGAKPKATQEPSGSNAEPISGRTKPPEPREKPAPATPKQPPSRSDIVPTPSARRALREHGLSPEDVPAAGKQLRREDVMRHVEQLTSAGDGHRSEPQAEKPTERSAQTAPQSSSAKENSLTNPSREQVSHRRPEESDEEVVPMTMIRRRIAERLVEAQQQAALLTTYNEIDMSMVMVLRKEFGERFQKRYDVKLGFMSFFVKAVVDALHEVPELNAEVRGTDIVYRYRYDIGIAIGSEHGLVVPVLRNADRLSFSEIERSIADFAMRAGTRKLLPRELMGGTFTISNGGIYGSLLSTPIVNPPQSGVLGMHAIQERPVARDGQVVIRPMMYVALTYDHRIIDGREAVSWLRRVKEAIEQPARMLIEA